MQRGKRPYRKFGQRLSEIRKGLSESVHEVSGAIEVDTDILERYENGEDRPSEDLLLLLINHFDVQDDEADELFELAGYGLGDSSAQPQPIIVVPMDPRILYTDAATITINENGVVLGFMQNGHNNQAVAVSRMGMSLEHAKKLSKLLQDSIDKAEQPTTPKLLSAPKAKRKTNNS